MEITVLSEDTKGQNGFDAEHGLSLYINTANHKIIADTGASELTWRNAQKAGIDVSAVDTVVISHGHYDHAGGLPRLLPYAAKAEIYLQRRACGEFYHGEKYIGIAQILKDNPRIEYVDGDKVIDGEISLFSGITGDRLRPDGNRELTEKKNGAFFPDLFSHEQCLVIYENGKYTLISGCAHNGILNILDRFRRIYGRDPDTVVSGFHMMKKTEFTEYEKGKIMNTAREMKLMHTQFYTGHCTGQPAFDIMKEIMEGQLHQIRSGDVFTV
ncbi:MAG: MBL fold metallo-hydrolase [Clostridia bacterium]|nr:MBL fold metallo-hydrolase [Clostridia bacterium]